MIAQKLAEEAVIDIIEADYRPLYKIQIWFSNGAERIVDFEPFLRTAGHPEIRKYLDLKLFRGFSIAHGQLNWHDYELCFSMQDLYEGTV